jgi:membrane dipeptidase
MNRREFSQLFAGTIASSLVPVSTSVQRTKVTPSIVSARGARLYRRALVLDCSSQPDLNGDVLPLPQMDLDIVRKCGVDVVKCSIGGINADFTETVRQIAHIQKVIEVHPAYFLPVRVPTDLERAKREKKMGIIFSFESVEMLEGKLERIELFRNLGVRVMQLSYNRSSPFAAGVLEPHVGGLTSLGRDAVRKMNGLGVAVDLSHANAQTTADVIAVTSKPAIISHAGCAAIHSHPRNKEDSQLRALATKGGVLGIYDLMYLTASPKQPAINDYMAHMEHALKVAGEDHVGVGSDVGITPFDTTVHGLAEYNKYQQERQKSGLAAPEEDRPPYVVGLNTPRKIEVIADQLLKRGYSARIVEKVVGANFVRVFNDTWRV